MGLGVGCPVSSLYTGQQLQRRTEMRWEQVPTCPLRGCTGGIQMRWLDDSGVREGYSGLAPPSAKWWMSFCHVTRGQSRTSRLSRVNSHTSALVDMEIWVHMETKEDNDRMKSCSDMCVCVCCVCIVCVPGNKQRKAKSQTIWDAESHTKSLAPLPYLILGSCVCVCVCVCVSHSVMSDTL